MLLEKVGVIDLKVLEFVNHLVDGNVGAKAQLADAIIVKNHFENATARKT